MKGFEEVRLGLMKNAAIWVNLEVLIAPISKFWKLKKKLKIFLPIFRGINCNFWRSNRPQKSGIFFVDFVAFLKQNFKAGNSIVIKKLVTRIVKNIAVK